MILFQIMCKVPKDVKSKMASGARGIKWLTHPNCIIAKICSDVKGNCKAVHFTLDRNGDFRYSGMRSAK